MVASVDEIGTILSGLRQDSDSMPLNAFHSERFTPVIQQDAIYGINTDLLTTGVITSGTTTTSGSSFLVGCGATQGGRGTITTKRQLRSRPGQCSVARWSADYPNTGIGAFSIAGIGHSEDGVFFGYFGNADFGIYYSRNGGQEARLLTISAGATSAGNVTVTLNGVAFVVAVTNGGGSTARTAWDIAGGTFTGWSAQAVGSTVIFIRSSVGPTAGAYTYAAGTTASAGSIALTKAGVALTTTFYPQTTWNVDKLDGLGPSGAVLDPTKRNVYQIKIGSYIQFQVEVTLSTGQNSFVVVHVINLNGVISSTMFGNSTLPFTMSSTQGGTTGTDYQVKVGKIACFSEGDKLLTGNRYSYSRQVTNTNDTIYRPLFSVGNMRYFKGRTNHAFINLLSIAGALKHTSPCVIYIIRNGTLTGNVSFASYSADSCSLYDTAATEVAFASPSQVIWSGHLGDTGQILWGFNDAGGDLVINPGEYITIAAKSSAGTPAYVTASINTREDI